MKMMNEMTIKNIVETNNREIDYFVNNIIPERIGAKNGKINFGQWCDAVGITKTEIYPKSKKIMDECRNAGFDVKINMQSYKLVYCGKL
jgi:hypothetical protein